MHLLVRIIIESLFDWKLRRQPGIKPGCVALGFVRIVYEKERWFLPVHTQRDQRSVVERSSTWTRDWCLYTLRRQTARVNCSRYYHIIL